MKLGKCGEDAAALFLKRENFNILSRNWSCECGELDIVAIKERTLIIIEVKTRRAEISEGFSPFAAVDSIKCEKLKKIADRYLSLEYRKLRRYKIQKVRFDVVGAFYRIDPLTNRLRIKVHHMIDAFNY